jgi:hypothetical protein
MPFDFPRNEERIIEESLLDLLSSENHKVHTIKSMGGKNNRLFRIHTDSADICAKYHPYNHKIPRRVTTACNEANMLVDLRSRGIGAPELLLIDGRPHAELYQGILYMYNFNEAETLKCSRIDGIKSLAVNLVKIHDPILIPPGIGTFSMLENALEDTRTALERYFYIERFASEPWAVNLLDRWEKGMRDAASEMAMVEAAGLKRTLVHGRMKPEHILCLKDGGLMIIDWETVCISERIMELAYIASRIFLNPEEHIPSLSVIGDLIRAYAVGAVLSLEESRSFGSIFMRECFWRLLAGYHEERTKLGTGIQKTWYEKATEAVLDIRTESLIL